MIRFTIFFLFVLLLFGCSSFRELHFFSDTTPGLPNYYRLKVSGFSLFSSSRYISGYFDPNAVNQYFNEFKQPEKGRLSIDVFGEAMTGDTIQASTLDSNLLSTSYVPLLAQKDKERLVLIYSTNSDAVSNQIGMISENEATMDALAFLLFEDRFDELSAIEVQDAVSKSRNKLLVSLGGPLVDSLNTTDSRAKIHASLLQYLNAIAVELGNSTPFSNFDDAEDWLNKNRSGILNSIK